MMTLADFDSSLAASAPPPDVPPLVAALWHDAKGDWQRAHRIAQDIEGRDAAWVHAYLHRKEGDDANAAYWYRRAGRPAAVVPLEQERREIVAALLEDT
jgi:hypothetical protein